MYAFDMNSLIVPVTDFIRRFGDYADMLPHVKELILTRDGRHFATITASPGEKNKKLLSLAGAWKGTELDSDDYWDRVLVRKNKKSSKRKI